ncbi:hypothetical protein F5148DRAFT_1153770 [Russula earlei]|uniref:Uncharacterized protein n=1 Tax=Russula earlei TaxID=71964 RepID=A0ACC0TSZ5_9AGAM|nr:hypothetical protein F5148DRAFT_1153770 [Russula earlei]
MLALIATGALLDNLAHNVHQNVEPAHCATMCMQENVWGGPVDPLLRLLVLPQLDTSGSASTMADGACWADADVDVEENADGGVRGGGVLSFDLILLSDLIFNHSQHRALLTTCEHAIAPAGRSFLMTQVYTAIKEWESSTGVPRSQLLQNIVGIIC